MFRIRHFHTSSLLNFPRMPFNPKKTIRDIKPKQPTKEALEAPIAEKKTYPQFPPRSYPPAHVRLSQPKGPKRHLTDVQVRPLPTTFAKGESFANFKNKELKCEPLSEGYHYPYRYYEVTLRRGVIGLPEATRKIVSALGFQKRHQVVWRLVSPKSAGQILKIKELVHVRLVNEIPAKITLPSGYKKTSSLIN
ncbi:39S ribosomal protein L33, mitochondrial [Terramyces sp. JEL0728]|nr:39S ribosomal protein L33, mitochondrial [Terramyces sp. JEL0728]